MEGRREERSRKKKKGREEVRREGRQEVGISWEGRREEGRQKFRFTESHKAIQRRRVKGAGRSRRHRRWR